MNIKYYYTFLLAVTSFCPRSQKIYLGKLSYLRTRVVSVYDLRLFVGFPYTNAFFFSAQLYVPYSKIFKIFTQINSRKMYKRVIDQIIMDGAGISSAGSSFALCGSVDTLVLQTGSLAPALVYVRSYILLNYFFFFFLLSFSLMDHTIRFSLITIL